MQSIVIVVTRNERLWCTWFGWNLQPLVTMVKKHQTTKHSKQTQQQSVDTHLYWKNV